MGLANQYGDLALEATLSALKTVADNLLLASEAIKTATEAINTKTTKVDTDHVAGAVSVSNQITQPLTDTQLRAADIKVTLDSEQITVANFPSTQPVSGTVSVSNMVSQGLTDTQLRATAVPVSGPLTDAQIRAAALPVSGTIAVSNQPSQPLTDTQLRAADVKITLDNEQVAVSNFPSSQAVTGPLTDSQIRATALPVSGPLTDAQLRATAIPVSGSVSVSNQLTQPLTDAQLRATALPVSVNNTNLATDAALEELQAIEQRIKALNLNIQRLSFDSTSQLRILISALPTLANVTTLATMTTGNIGFGDCGKASAAILTSSQAFQLGVGANFTRS